MRKENDDLKIIMGRTERIDIPGPSFNPTHAFTPYTPPRPYFDNNPGPFGLMDYPKL